jgi:threonine dehydrogenase-like Zn-dependent dehydrogenase
MKALVYAGKGKRLSKIVRNQTSWRPRTRSSGSPRPPSARNITITTRLVDAASTSMLLKTLISRKIDPKLLVTHRFPMDKIVDAYEAFGNADRTKALKVLIEA